MPSIKSAPKKTATPSGPKDSKPTGEIKDRDLDKVSGGLKRGRGPRPGDPCAGGE